jgi:ABC-type spermidine/putrescine transport system permease subunit II
MLRFGLKPEITALAVIILLASSLLVVASLVVQNRSVGTSKSAAKATAH